MRKSRSSWRFAIGCIATFWGLGFFLSLGIHLGPLHITDITPVIAQETVSAPSIVLENSPSLIDLFSTSGNGVKPFGPNDGSGNNGGNNGR